MLGRTRHAHFIGIGGSGMCGIAEVLLTQGYRVSGSDQSQGDAVRRLQRLGATVFVGHAREQVHGADAVVVLDVPLLVENPRTGLCGILVVDLDTEIAIERLVGQRGLTEADARARVARQSSRSTRRAGRWSCR